MRTRIALALMLCTVLAGIAGCGQGSIKSGYFYVASTSEGYKVASDDQGSPFTRYYTIGLTVDQATSVANKLNQDIPYGFLADPHTTR